MFRSKKQIAKALSLALSITMLLCSLLALPASAHDAEDCSDDFVIIATRVIREGYSFLGAGTYSVSSCSHPNLNAYMYKHDPHSTSDYCIVIVREYCPDCGWYRDVECLGVGGHSSFLSLPPWTGFTR